MAQIEKLNDDLTTDALASPSRPEGKRNTTDENNGDDKTSHLNDETNTRLPRDKENTGDENVFEDDGDEKIPQSDEDTQFKNSRSSSAGTSRTAFRKITPSSAVYQMVNISYSKGVHIGDNIVHNHNGVEQLKKTNIIETAAIKSLKLRTDKLTREDMLFVSAHMDSTWKDTARAMNFSEGEISQFVSDHQHSGTKEVIFQVLLDWYQNNPTEATIGNLCEILWNTNQKDVVRRLSLKKKSKK